MRRSHVADVRAACDREAGRPAARVRVGWQGDPVNQGRRSESGVHPPTYGFGYLFLAVDWHVQRHGTVVVCDAPAKARCAVSPGHHGCDCDAGRRRWSGSVWFSVRTRNLHAACPSLPSTRLASWRKRGCDVVAGALPPHASRGPAPRVDEAGRSHIRRLTGSVT